MQSVYICYRRTDSAGHAGRLFDALTQHFGHDHVFKDIDTIEIGTDFGDVVNATLERADVVLALIGRQWLSSADVSGRRRLDNPEDFIRLELEGALNSDTYVIPVLIQGASMPHPDELPRGLKGLAERNAIELADTRWHHGVDVLVRALEQIAERRADVLASPGPAGKAIQDDVIPAAHAHVFVSYASDDRPQVFPFVDSLRERSVPIWIDDGDIDAALLWSEVIVEAIEQCAAFIVMLSGSAAASPNVVREIVLASEYTKPIVPLLIEPVEIPRSMRYQLAGIQHINLYDRNEHENLRRVLRSLQRLGLHLDQRPVAG